MEDLALPGLQGVLFCLAMEAAQGQPHKLLTHQRLVQNKKTKGQMMSHYLLYIAIKVHIYYEIHILIYYEYL